MRPLQGSSAPTEVAEHGGGHLGLLHGFAFFRQESADELIGDLVKPFDYTVFDRLITADDAFFNGLIDFLGAVSNLPGNFLGLFSGLFRGLLLAARFHCLGLRLRVHGVF